MMAYWNQNSDDLYDSVLEALDDFENVEGTAAMDLLKKEMIIIRSTIGFPSLQDLPLDASHEFWGKFDRIIVLEDYSKWEIR